MKKYILPLLVIFACAVMGVVDAVVQPGYAVKSAIKIVLFLLIPVLYAVFTKDKSTLKVF